MSSSRSSSLLRRALIVDAAVSGATGLVMVLDAGVLQELLDLPTTLLRYAGSSLLPFAAMLTFLSRHRIPSPAGTRAVIAMNAAWVAASFLLLLTAWLAPNPLGCAFVIGLALAVAVLTAVQYVGLQKSAAAVA